MPFGPPATRSSGPAPVFDAALDPRDPSARGWSPPAEFDEYRLVRLLGRGTMGQVYLAHDRVLDRPVAVKFITALEPSTRERFLVEARAAARIQHPNVMAMYRVGELDHHPYLITEYVRGKNLSELTLPLPWRKALELGIGLARGLAAAHRQGVLHRDIKLANAMLSERGDVKLLDFSLAKLESGGPPTATMMAMTPALGQPAARPREKSAANDGGTQVGRSPSGGLSDAVKAARRMADTIRVDAATVPEPDSPVTKDTLPGMPQPAAPPSALGRRFDREFTDGWRGPGADITEDGALMGTPHYMAPELWRAEPATRRSDVYALGVLLYTLCCGCPPTDAKTTLQLATRVQEQDPRPLLERAPGVDPRLAAMIDRCVRRNPAERFASGEELRVALEALMPLGREGYVPAGNPFRGLQAFEAEHRDLFFGRTAEIQTVVDRLRAQPFVLVAGDSGVGKSSLCRAGVLPLINEGLLEPQRTWYSTSITPGRRPVQSLISALASGLDIEEESFIARVRAEPDALDRALRRQQGQVRGRIIFVDQLEELVTLARPAEAAFAARLLARLANGIEGVRLLATARGDFLTRIAQLPGLGEEIARGLYFLPPLTEAGVRQAIVGPAETKGVRFESEALVDRLVKAGVEGSLPLLQFALAEMWEARDQSSDAISAAALDKIGGVSGALARHADGVLARLSPAERRAARHLLLRLVTIDSTRASMTQDELVSEEAGRAALEALVAARLLVVRDVPDGPVYEIAHEALIHGWVTLQVWLEEENEARLVRHRLEAAATDWDRLGRRADGLWNERQLAELRLLDAASLRPRETAFVAASEARVRRRRHLRNAAVMAAPLLVALGFVGVRAVQSAGIDRRVESHLGTAAGIVAEARRADDEVDRRRAHAFARFDVRDREGGEQAWSLARAAQPEVERLYNRAAREHERALLAERDHQPSQVEDLLSRVQLYDDSGARMAKWRAPARLRVVTAPSGAQASLSRYERDDRGELHLGDTQGLGGTPVADFELPAGSYLLTLSAPGHAPVRYPVLLHRDEDLAIAVDLPLAADIPDGFVYVPAGRFLFGSRGDDDMRRGFFVTVPLHEVHTEGYLIARHETTYADWIAYLESLAPDERAQRLSKSDGSGFQQAPSLTQLPDGTWQIGFQMGAQVFTAREGEPIRYSKRQKLAEQDWLKFPVTGLTWEDGKAYMAWLDRTGRVPGARFCDEFEWERAARGADGRRFPTGDDIAPDEANYDETYGRELTAMGPNEVGSFAASESPFGLHDTTGNVWEWVESTLSDGETVVRGGAFFFAKLTGASVNRNVVESNFRDGTLGLRVCATPRFRT